MGQADHRQLGCHIDHPVARGVVHGGHYQVLSIRKKIMEAYVNEVLSNNSSLGAQGKPPMEFDKLNKLALKFKDKIQRTQIEEKDRLKTSPTFAHTDKTLGR